MRIGRRYYRSGPACAGGCDNGEECRPIYQAQGPSAYACVDAREPAVIHQDYQRAWSHTVDPRPCARSGMGCSAGRCSRRRAHDPYRYMDTIQPYSPLFWRNR